jgi:hypothetical protein
VIVAHSKLAGGELCIGCLPRISEGKLLVLLEDAFVAKQKPTTDAQSSLGVALIGS